MRSLYYDLQQSLLQPVAAYGTRQNSLQDKQKQPSGQAKTAFRTIPKGHILLFFCHYLPSFSILPPPGKPSVQRRFRSPVAVWQMICKNKIFQKYRLSINNLRLLSNKERLFSNNLGLFPNTPYLFQNTPKVILITPKVNYVLVKIISTFSRTTIFKVAKCDHKTSSHWFYLTKR